MVDEGLVKLYGHRTHDQSASFARVRFGCWWPSLSSARSRSSSMSTGIVAASTPTSGIVTSSPMMPKRGVSLSGKDGGAHSVSATDRNEWVVLEHLTTETVLGDRTTE